MEQQEKRRLREKKMLRVRIDGLIFALNELMEEEHDALALNNYEAVLKEESRWIEQARRSLKPLP